MAVTLRHRDGRERVVETPAERVAAEFDGFVEKTSRASAPKADGEKKAPAKRAAAKRGSGTRKTAAKVANAAKPGDGGPKDPAHVDPNA